MASMCARFAFTAARKNVLQTSTRLYADQKMTEPLEHATGLEKRQLLKMAQGDDNPFDYKVIKRVSGTQDQPTLIPSAFDSRIVGCVCHEEATAVQWMWLYKNEPKRCACGYWFKLEEKAPL